MQPQTTPGAPYREGDKVRIKNSIRGTANEEHAGKRGQVAHNGDHTKAPHGMVRVRLDGEDAPLMFAQEYVQNRTLSAQRSWVTTPRAGRRVGRPRLTTPKTTVALRIDLDAWETLGRIVESGRIATRSRNEIVNTLLRDYVLAVGDVAVGDVAVGDANTADR